MYILITGYRLRPGHIISSEDCKHFLLLPFIRGAVWMILPDITK